MKRRQRREISKFFRDLRRNEDWIEEVRPAVYYAMSHSGHLSNSRLRIQPCEEFIKRIVARWTGSVPLENDRSGRIEQLQARRCRVFVEQAFVPERHAFLLD